MDRWRLTVRRGRATIFRLTCPCRHRTMGQWPMCIHHMDAHHRASVCRNRHHRRDHRNIGVHPAGQHTRGTGKVAQKGVKMSVAIGYVPGAFGQGGQDPNFLRQLVQVGDTYGYDSIWLSDRIVSQQFSLEPIVALSMVAAYSDRLKFGTSVLALPIRHPVVLAKQIATLDYLSRGRCFPAVGLGQEDPTEYEACGVPESDLGQRTE